VIKNTNFSAPEFCARSGVAVAFSFAVSPVQYGWTPRGFKAPACNSLSFLVAARGANAAFGGLGFALKTAPTFDVFYWLQVTNYGVLYVLFDPAPSGSNYIDVWDLCLHAPTASTIISSQRFSDESRREQAEKLFDRVRKSCTHNQSPITIGPFTPYRNRTANRQFSLFLRGLFPDAFYPHYCRWQQQDTLL
jgi:hypothetical protein